MDSRHSDQATLADLKIVTIGQLARLNGLINHLSFAEDLQVELIDELLDLGSERIAKEDDPSWEVKQIELKLRQLSSQDAQWPAMKTLAWRLFKLNGHAKAAAQLVETVFLTGTIHDTLDVLVALNESNLDYYFSLPIKFREHLAFRLMQAHKTSTLDHFLSNDGDHGQCSPLELLYIFRRYNDMDQRADRFIFFRNYETELVEAVAKFGPTLGISPSKFAVEIGTEAAALGFIDIAKRLVQDVSPTEPEYQDALQLQMVLEFDPDDPAGESYFKKIERCENWRERLAMFAGFIEDCRKRKGGQDIRRPALNELVADFSRWLPETTAAMAEFSGIIARHSDLHELLPALFNLYRERALAFDTPAVEAAVWKPALQELSSEHPVSRYWRGVASLHVYLALAEGHEELLWSAKRRVESADERWAFVLPFRWTELHHAAVNYIARSPHLNEAQRQQTMSQLNVAAQLNDVSLTDIDLYVQATTAAPFAVLSELRQIAAARQALTLELNIIRLMGESSSYTNQNLARSWQLAAALNDQDLAWRCATVLESRQSLDEKITQPWSISGERRSEYPFMRIALPEIDRCQLGFNKEQRRLIKDILYVGPLIPELLAGLDQNAVSLKLDTPGVNTVEGQVERAIQALGWFPHSKRSFRFNNEAMLSTMVQLPTFLDMIPSNVWSFLFLRLAERLGLNAWQWQLSRLHTMLDGALPRMTSGSTQDIASANVAKWLRSLKPESRTAWHDLLHLKSKLSDQQVTDTLAIFLIRIAISMMPAHMQALKSLQTMRAPLYLIRGAESWLLSQPYSDFRAQYALKSTSIVPHNLRTADIVRGKSSFR